MQQATLKPYFNLYDFTTGRRLFAVGEVQVRAEQRGLDDIVLACDASLAHDRETVRVERQWRRAKQITAGARTEAVVQDRLLDRVIGAFHETLKSEARGFEGGPRGEAAAAVLAEVFPDGARTVIQQPYENELAMAVEIVDALRGRFAPQVATLGLDHYVDRIEAIAADFRAALGDEQTRPVDYDQVRAARAQGQELMLRVVAMVLGQFNGAADGDVAARRDLLAPILAQNERIGELYSRHQPVPDVEPHSGEEVVEDPAPTDANADAGSEDAPVANDPEAV